MFVHRFPYYIRKWSFISCDIRLSKNTDANNLVLQVIELGDGSQSFQVAEEPGGGDLVPHSSQIESSLAAKNYGRAHKCPYCTYQTGNTTHLKNHIMFKHTNERPFPCPLCHKRFGLKTDLKLHMRTHTGEKPFQCHKCGMMFALKGNLKAHLQNKRGCRKSTSQV